MNTWLHRSSLAAALALALLAVPAQAQQDAAILKRATENATEVMRGLVAAGIMRASAEEVQALATNLLVIATFWLNYTSVHGERDEHEAIQTGIRQVMMMLAPFLRDAERVHIHTLTSAYVR